MNFFALKGRTLLMTAALVAAAAGSAGAANITAEFVDTNFRAEVYKLINKTAPAQILDSDVRGITGVSVVSRGISDLSGIEYFTALTRLFCYGNKLTALDLSKNTALTELYCYSNKLTELNVSKNTKLKTLSIYGNQLTALDVSNNTALTILQCDNNQLSALDVSNNTALTQLQCLGNRLTALDVSANTALTNLNCHSNQLTALDVSNNTALIYLTCYNNQLSVLDVSKNTALTVFLYSQQTRSGYILEGWYIDEAYTDRFNGSIPPNLTLYAKWTPVPGFTITFNASGGTVIPESATTRVDSTLVSLPTPTRSDYSFIGWFTTETGGEMVTASKKYSANTIIYAQWTRDATYAFSSDRVIPSVIPADGLSSVSAPSALAVGFAAGPNPAVRSSGNVDFFRGGVRVSRATLSVYDAAGKVVRRIRVIDGAAGGQSPRKVASWDLRDAGGRLVSEGTYLVKGAVKTKDGKRERVSLVVGVR
ncbi:hypothetical protein R80B4_01265 [Fibrobacteres bacterium R8-0-B4]